MPLQRRRSKGDAGYSRVSSTIQRIVGWSTLGVVCGSALLLAANRPIGWLFLAVVTGLLFAVQILRDMLTPGIGKRFLRILPAALLWLGVLIWALFQAGPAPNGWAHPAWAEAGIAPGSISVDPEASLHGVLRLAAYAAIFWIAAEAGRDIGRNLAMLKALAVWQIVLGFFGIAAFYTAWNPILGEARSGVSASFLSPNAYAIYAGMGLYCCFVLIILDFASRDGGDSTLSQIGRKLLDGLMGGSIMAWGGMVVLSAAMLYSGSRAGTAAVITGFIVLIFVMKSGGRLHAVLVMAAALPLLASMLGAHKLIDDFTNIAGETMRPEVYARTVEAIATVPWQGVGLGGYREAFRAFMTPEISRFEFDLAHNSYLENIFELGLLAAVAMYLALFWIGLQIWLGIGRRERLKAIPALGIAAMAAGGLHAVVDFSLQMPAVAGFFAFLLGLAWACSFREGGQRRQS